MYRLYWSKGTASFAPQAVLEEAGLDYELVRLDRRAGDNLRPDYLAINPLGKVPAIQLPDGRLMADSAAICLFIADTHGLAGLAPDLADPLRPRFLQWLFYMSNTIQELYNPYYYPERFSSDPAHAPGIRDRATQHLLRQWSAVDTHLAADGPFHLGDRFSIVDIYMTMLAAWHLPPEALFAECPAVETAFRRVSTRPAVARCLAEQTAIDPAAAAAPAAR